MITNYTTIIKKVKNGFTVQVTPSDYNAFEGMAEGFAPMFEKVMDAGNSPVDDLIKETKRKEKKEGSLTGDYVFLTFETMMAFVSKVNATDGV